MNPTGLTKSHRPSAARVVRIRLHYYLLRQYLHVLQVHQLAEDHAPAPSFHALSGVLSDPHAVAPLTPLFMHAADRPVAFSWSFVLSALSAKTKLKNQLRPS